MRTVVTLIQIKAGLMTMWHIDFKTQAGVADRHLRRRRNTRQQTDMRLQALEREHVGIRTFEDCFWLQRRRHRIDYRVAPAHRARTRQLQDDDIAITIDHHTGQPVGLGMHQTHCLASGQHALAQGSGASDALKKKRRVNFTLLPIPYATDDLRMRITRRDSE